MAPGERAFPIINEAGISLSDYLTVPESEGFRSSPYKHAATIVNNKVGMPSDTAVHDLFECPVCMNIMYPPIQQVSSDINLGMTIINVTSNFLLAELLSSMLLDFVQEHFLHITVRVFF